MIIDSHGHVTAPDSLYVYKAQILAHRGAHGRGGNLANDEDVSRHHAVIIDTGAGFVIYDSRSTNGVEVRGQRIRGSATLADGDRIRIGNCEFIVEIHPS